MVNPVEIGSDMVKTCFSNPEMDLADALQTAIKCKDVKIGVSMVSKEYVWAD